MPLALAAAHLVRTRLARVGSRGLAARIEAMIAAEQGRFVLWLPVFMGAGVLLYFALRAEPPAWAGVAIAVPAGLGAWLGKTKTWTRALLLPLAVGALGFALAQFATARAPPLEPLPFHAVVLSGTVAGVEVLPEGRRITIARARLDDRQPLRRRVRVRLRANDRAEIGAGDEVSVRALLRAPSPPAYPGGWDLQRDAFFAGLAGYGFAIGPTEVLAHHPPSGLGGWLQGLRETIARRFEAQLPGAKGAVAATLFTGSPSTIPESDREAFRASGLAHLLAVAGLHIGIIMGLAFGVTRIVLAAWEHAALHWPTKQIAAAAALLAGGAYMVLTGMHVPILRSFAMASLVTLGVMIGRRGVSLRGLAVAAVAMMLVEPEQVAGVSFQMSFSAVLALISGYEALQPVRRALRGDGSRWRRIALWILGLALTSLLAGGASAPFGAYHFGRVQIYFVVANMVAVPLTALWVMPAGVIGLALMPFGLERLALVPMGWGVQAILLVARAVAAWPASVVAVPHMPAWGLVLTSLGIAWLGIWRSWIRLAGIAVLALGLASSWLVRPPDLLVAADGRMIGLRTQAGMWIERVTGASNFTRAEWQQYWAAADSERLPADGSVGGDQVGSCTPDSCLLRPHPDAVAALLLRRTPPPDCGSAAVVVSLINAWRRCPEAALVDRITVLRQGAAAIWLEPGGARIVTDRMVRGARPWVPPPRPRSKPPAPRASGSH